MLSDEAYKAAQRAHEQSVVDSVKTQRTAYYGIEKVGKSWSVFAYALSGARLYCVESELLKRQAKAIVDRYEKTSR